MRAPPVWYKRAEQLRRENHTLQKISDLLGIAIPTIRTQLIQRMDAYDDFIQPTHGNEVAGRTCRIQNESSEVVQGQRVMKTFPIPLFMALAPAEILEIIYKELTR